MHGIRRILGWVHALIATLIVGGIATQVFLAGMNVFVRPAWLSAHIQLGHALGGLIVLGLAAALGGGLGRRMCLANGALLLLMAIQYNHRTLAAAFNLPELAAVHALNALALFWGAVLLARWSWADMRPSSRMVRG